MKLNEAECVTCIIYYYYLLINHYYVLLLHLLLLIITVFVITLLLHYYYALLHYSLLRIIAIFVITLLLHHYYAGNNELIITGNNELKQVIMSSLLHIMYYPCFHYYIVITHSYHYYPLLHVTNGATQ